MRNIVSLEDPPFPLLCEMVCVYLVLAECQGRGTVQIRVSFVDDELEQPVFGTPVHDLDFAGVGPLDAIGIPFRIRDCPFPRPGGYAVQFWYNGQKLDDRPLRVR
ncbi:unnamed protein product [Gemmataceae bacterium]|jgi:hypothetical protein|nr:unnamed protein product [Gemmataceae bacterium]VTU00737.1 unnamed protein product [Gemmataceae bacterium]